MIEFLLQNLSGRIEEYLENLSGPSAFRSRFEPFTPIIQSEATDNEIMFRVSCCGYLHVFVVFRSNAANILWIILCSTDKDSSIDT
jgi:hypothetical protein